MPTTQQIIEMTETYSAHNYKPLPIVIAHAEGAWVTDRRASGTSTSWPPTRR